MRGQDRWVPGRYVAPPVTGFWVPASFKGGLGDVGSRNHLFSRPDPQDGPIVTLGATVQFETGEASPGEGHLWRHANTAVSAGDRRKRPAGAELGGDSEG